MQQYSLDPDPNKRGQLTKNIKVGVLLKLDSLPILMQHHILDPDQTQVGQAWKI